MFSVRGGSKGEAFLGNPTECSDFAVIRTRRAHSSGKISVILCLTVS